MPTTHSRPAGTGRELKTYEATGPGRYLKDSAPLGVPDGKLAPDTVPGDRAALRTYAQRNRAAAANGYVETVVNTRNGPRQLRRVKLNITERQRCWSRARRQTLLAAGKPPRVISRSRVVRIRARRPRGIRRHSRRGPPIPSADPHLKVGALRPQAATPLIGPLEGPR